MDEKPFETMNVIPFVDIMLVLLTIVLTTSSFIANGRIPVRLPRASQQPADARPAAVIELSAPGGTYFNGEAVSLDALRGRLEPLGRATAFVVRADGEVSLQRFVDVVDLLKQLSFANVAIQTRARN